MTVLLVADGASIHTRRWAAGLAARGHRVIVASETPPDDTGAEWVPLAAPRRGRLNLPAVARALAAAARRLRPDVVHAHYASHYGILAAAAGCRPLVVSVWGADVEVFPRRSVLHRRILQWALGRADRLTATSGHLAQVARALAPATVPVEVVPFGVDTAFFAPAPPSGELVVVSNKHLEPVYGGDLLLEALARVRSQGIPARLALLGGGSQADALSRRAKALALDDVVDLPGPLPPEAVRTWLVRAAVAAYPSYRESFGVATLEASAVGRPVIASRVGGLPEVVVDGVTGVLVPVGDIAALAAALAELLRDPARRAVMGAAGARWVREHFAWTASLDRMEAVYREVRGSG
ncbi:MAG: glycosyltransferase [Actinomycetia bacterium]|nr:glycosyltransferase [Actinomycetes bacterium]